MKKRIIALILVVATAFLTLTGCAFNYAKKDMSKYTAFNSAAFLESLQKLSIKDGDFGTDEAKRLEKVEDAIAAAILKLTDADDKLFAGKADKYDSLYFCYYATDEAGNIYFASKMDESKPSSIQLGLTTLTGLNKAISEKVLNVSELADHIYSTSSANVVGEGDSISISYVKEHKGENDKPVIDETADHKYITKVDSADSFLSQLIGKQVGVDLGTITDSVTTGEGDAAVTTKYTYTNVKVESIAKDNSTNKVEAGDVVFVTYTRTFETWDGFDATKFPNGKVDSEGKYSETATYTVVMPKADAEGEKTFEGQLVGKSIGTVDNITGLVENITDKDGTVKEDVTVDYKNIKINWIVNEANDPIEVKYTPYEEELKDDKSNKKTEKDVYGTAQTLNGVELTYCVFPVYYLDVEELSAELIVREFYSTLASTQTVEHEHTDEEHEHETEYVFDTLNEEYKNGDKTIGALVEELVELYNGREKEDDKPEIIGLVKLEKDLNSALTALEKAQSNLATEEAKAEPNKTTVANLKTSLGKAEDAYEAAVKDFNDSQKKVDEKIAEVLACKKGETGVDASLVQDYKDYQYDTLEAAYKADIKAKLAAEIYKSAQANVSYSELPKRAVKDAYNAIINTYKYSFYEENFSTGSSSSSTSTESNYSHYNGDFDAYLIGTLKVDSIEAAEAKIQKEAEQTVEDIMLIYVLVDVFGEDEVGLTKEEKKNLETNLKNMSLIYQQYGLSYSYNLDDYTHAAQFDKVFNHLLEEAELPEEAQSNTVVYKNISYTIKAAEDK